MKKDIKLIRIDCPLCSRFLAYVKPESDVFCPRCQKFIYMGLKSNDAALSKTKASSTALS